MATAELLKGPNEIKFTGVGVGNTTIEVSFEDNQTTYKYNVTVEAATYTLTPAASPADGGTASAGKTEGIAEGEVVKIEATPKDGWEFVKWEGAAAIADPAAASTTVTMPASDATVTAMFRKKAEPVPVTTYVVTYDANGGTGSMGKQTADVGATVVLTANAFTRDGYTFAGWNTAKDGSGTAYADKASVKLEGNMTLYAQWSESKPAPVATYVIKFDANDGRGSMDDLVGEEGSTVTLTANAFTRDGYTFAGWNTAKDGSGTAYKDKGEVKLEGDMTLYAQWTKKAATAKSSLAKTGDAVVPAAAIALIAALAVSALFFARRRMG